MERIISRFRRRKKINPPLHRNEMYLRGRSTGGQAEGFLVCLPDDCLHRVLGWGVTRKNEPIVDLHSENQSIIPLQLQTAIRMNMRANSRVARTKNQQGCKLSRRIVEMSRLRTTTFSLYTMNIVIKKVDVDVLINTILRRSPA